MIPRSYESNSQYRGILGRRGTDPVLNPMLLKVPRTKALPRVDIGCVFWRVVHDLALYRRNLL